MVSTGTVLGLGAIGAAAGGALMAFGITPDLMADNLKDQITTLASSNADALANTGIEVVDATGKAALENSHHLIEHGDKFIAVTKDGVQAIPIDGLSGDALKAAQAMNAHFVEPSVLTKTLTDFATVTPENADAAKEALGNLIGAEHAGNLVDSALSGGGKLAEEALSTIGSTPFEQSQFLSNAIPPAAGAVAGLGVGAMLPASEKPVIGPATQRLMAERQAALQQQLRANGVQMS